MDRSVGPIAEPHNQETPSSKPLSPLNFHPYTNDITPLLVGVNGGTFGPALVGLAFAEEIDYILATNLVDIGYPVLRACHLYTFPEGEARGREPVRH